MAKMTLKVKVNDLYFQYQQRVTQNVCLVQIWWFQPTSIIWRVITGTSRSFLSSESKWPKWPWRSRSMTSMFNTSREYPRVHVWCKFGDSSPNLWRVMARINRIFYNSETKWPKWPWRSRSMTPIFKTNRECLMIHVWCKFGDSSSNLWRVMVRTRWNLWTDGPADRRRQRQYPFGLRGQRVKSRFRIS